jgi:uncharacterized protein
LLLATRAGEARDTRGSEAADTSYQYFILHIPYFQMFLRYPKIVLWVFIIFSILGSILAAFRVKFSFDLEDFFPDNDPDLEYFNQFKANFEPDDNFLLLAIRREAGAFDSLFMSDILRLSLSVRNIEFASAPFAKSDKLDTTVFFQQDGSWRLRPIVAAQSLLQLEYPIKTPFAFTTIDAVHLDQPELYASDLRKALSDERVAGNLISRDGKTLVIAMKTVDNIQQPDAEKLMLALHDSLAKYPRLSDYHLLGRANFQKEMVEFQIKEFTFAVLVSGFLVLLVMYLIFRRFWGVVVASSSILFGLFLFIALLGVLGAKLDTMALLYPIVMIIVATSDVIHVMSKYIDELSKGQEKMTAIKTTIREIGASILLTSATTSIGFVSLMSSKIPPVRNFGFNAALGVMLAYLTVMTFTVAILALFDKDTIVRSRSADGGRFDSFWNKVMAKIDFIAANYKWRVLSVAAIFIAICVLGALKVSTNNQLAGLLPRGAKITADFQFFEQNFGGFRPLEIAVTIKKPLHVDSFEVVQTIDKIEQHLRSYNDNIQNITSVTMIYKSMHRAFNGDNKEYYMMPEATETFEKYQRFAKKMEQAQNISILASADGQYARISARILDIGADSIKHITQNIDTWLGQNIDTTRIVVHQTGTGLIVDKNSEYIRDSLLWGLLFAVGIIAIIMVFLYRQLSMVLVALIPNMLPLLFAAAMLGYLNIPLEGGVAIVFSIIFGIAVDDTIHFLGRYKLLRNNGKNVDEAITTTLLETGKAMVLTSLTLFGGFFVLLFSANPAANTVGLLISSTLFTALICDLFILPILLRMISKDAK